MWGVPVAPHAHQHSILSVFFTLARPVPEVVAHRGPGLSLGSHEAERLSLPLLALGYSLVKFFPAGISSSVFLFSCLPSLTGLKRSLCSAPQTQKLLWPGHVPTVAGDRVSNKRYNMSHKINRI